MNSKSHTSSTLVSIYCCIHGVSIYLVKSICWGYFKSISSDQNLLWYSIERHRHPGYLSVQTPLSLRINVVLYLPYCPSVTTVSSRYPIISGYSNILIWIYRVAAGYLYYRLCSVKERRSGILPLFWSILSQLLEVSTGDTVPMNIRSVARYSAQPFPPLSRSWDNGRRSAGNIRSGKFSYGCSSLNAWAHLKWSRPTTTPSFPSAIILHIVFAVYTSFRAATGIFDVADYGSSLHEFTAVRIDQFRKIGKNFNNPFPFPHAAITIISASHFGDSVLEEPFCHNRVTV